MADPLFEITVQHAGAELARYPLAPGEYTIGRSSASSIPIQVGPVSRQHARLFVSERGAVQVEDLASANGTLLDEQPIAGLSDWWPGQILRIGDAALTLTATALDATGVIRQHLPLVARQSQDYAIGAEVARGGMGAVLQARESATRRTVAMKVMLGRSDAKSTLRFIEEAQVTAQLEHPNIVPVHDLGIDAHGQPYYTMKLVAGITLKKVLELLRQRVPETVRKYPLGTLLTAFQKIGDALAFAHSRGVIHRDLKPANIMLGKYGEVLVMDWGLAKIIGTGGGPTQAETLNPEATVIGARREQSDVFSTQDGAVMGTAHYMSPEQARGEVETLDARSDVFTLGIILYELLTLARPFTGQTAGEIVNAVIEGNAVPPAECVRALPKAGRPAHLPGGEVPPSLDAIIRKALAPDRAARYPSVADLQRDLTAYQNSFATGAEKAGAWQQVKLLIKRNKAASIGIAAVLVLGAAFTARVVAEKNRTANALRDLRAQAPAFADMAHTYVEQLNLPAAREKLDSAIKLDPTRADYHARRGDTLQTQLQFGESIAAYDRALALKPDDAKTKAARALSARLVTSKELAATELNQLAELLMQQGRLTEAVALTPRLIDARETQQKIFGARLRQLHPGTTTDVSWVFHHAGDGRYDVDLGLLKKNAHTLEALRGVPLRAIRAAGNVPISDLSPLTGARLESLDLYACKITNVRLLHGMPLQRLNLNYNPLESLAGLEGCPLTYADFLATPIRDLLPLTGAPLKELQIAETNVEDLSPLHGAPLDELNCNRTKVRSLEALRGMKLHSLDIGLTSVTSLEPLRGMPLEALYIGSTHVMELSPLVGMPLRVLSMDAARSVQSLVSVRDLPIEYLNIRSTIVEDFDTLAHLRLKGLNASFTKLADGGVLRGQPLEVLLLAGCEQLKDLAFLKTLPDLKALSLPEALVSSARGLPGLRYLSTSDYTAGAITLEWAAKEMPTVETFWAEYDDPLRKNVAKNLAQVEAAVRVLSLVTNHETKIQDPWGVYLQLNEQPIVDVRPLRSLPIDSLSLFRTKVTDLAPLRGMRLKALSFDDTAVADVSPLLDMPILEAAMLTQRATNIEVLRNHKTLKYLGWDGDWDSDALRPKLTTAEFWTRYDALHPAGAK